jgi:hypothetical protein
MKRLYSICLLACLAILTGCATGPAQPILFDQAKTSLANSTVAIVVGDIPKPNSYFPGASCLLCLGLAEIANNKLTTFAKLLPTTDLAKVKTEFVELFKSKGIKVVDLPESFTIASLPDVNKKEADAPLKDFTSLRAQHNVDKVIVLNFYTIGMYRNYASYIPTGAPLAKIQGLGYLVDLTNNKYQWYQPVDIQKGTDGDWDEPPQFAGLTNAWFQAIELSKDVVLGPFKAK